MTEATPGVEERPTLRERAQAVAVEMLTPHIEMARRGLIPLYPCGLTAHTQCDRIAILYRFFGPDDLPAELPSVSPTAAPTKRRRRRKDQGTPPASEE